MIVLLKANLEVKVKAVLALGKIGKQIYSGILEDFFEGRAQDP